MYELSNILLTAAIALLVGLGVGALLGRRMSVDGRKQRELERSVDKLLQQQKDYQHEVVSHFTDTSRLLNNLAESYRDVHNHLAKGASSLCADEAGSIMKPIPDASLSQLTAATEPAADAVKPPLDYAPKGSPYATGVLNEEFGLDRNTPPPASEPVEVVDSDARAEAVASDAETIREQA